MNKLYISFLIALLFFLVTSTAFAAPKIDGVMSYKDKNDWGSLEHTNFKEGFKPNQNLTNVSVEEGKSYGSDYDLEELGVYINENILYIGIQTQFDLKNGIDPVKPGDFIFNFDESSKKFKKDNKDSDDFAFSFKISDCNNNGVFDVDFTLMAGNLVSGSKTTDYNNYGKDWKITSSDYQYEFKNTGKYVKGNTGYENNYYNGSNTIEAAINLNELSGELSDLFAGFAKKHTSVTMFWQPSCGNDFLAARSDFTYEVSHTPEPATLALFGLGLLGIGSWGRRQKS